MKRISTTLVLLLFALLPRGAAGADAIEGARIAADTRFLSSDLLEGRGVGARGGEIATEYLATQLALAGVKPAGDKGTYFQNFDLAGVETQADATLSFTRDGQTTPLHWLSDWVGANEMQEPTAEIDAEAVFVGHGIVAPEFQWDDYKGVDVAGKIVVLFTNEPGRENPALFRGKALMYYGRWSYKFEEALRHGALGALIIHTDDTAGYDWNVVRNSWGKELQMTRRPQGERRLSLTAWITAKAAEPLIAGTGKSVAELLAAAESRDFQPIPLGVRVKANLPSRVRVIPTRNVVGIIPGSDAALGEAILYSAHWDHLGMASSGDGDRIFNGAVDNATGCRYPNRARPVPKPKRAAVFAFAGKSGLRGSEYYAHHPVVPLSKTIVDLNYDGILPGGDASSVVVNGAERTTLWPLVETVAKRYSLNIVPDPAPEQGYFYRSDHFSLAKAGVPAFSVDVGDYFAGKPAEYGRQYGEAYRLHDYHQPSDEFHEDWDFSGIARIVRFGFTLGIEAANGPGQSAWRPGDEFQAAREKSFRDGN
ncbi:MAG: M28 family peptidase [Bryobacterales bacterium]|nr:M28 family peptidase [Bryobacterales bacterium]